MIASEEPLPNELTAQETAAVLQRILSAVERDQRNHWSELACAFVLSLAMLASAWCATQSNLWSGVQTFRLVAANKAGRASAAATLAALQMRAFDAAMLISYLQAQTQGNKPLEKILYERFRPEMKNALEAWLKTDPLNDPVAPRSPFKMAEYVQPELNEAKRYEDISELEHSGAQQANVTSDTYVLLTVAFTSVLFFGGIGGSFRSRRLRIGFFIVSLVIFVVTMVFLGSMPICRK